MDRTKIFVPHNVKNICRIDGTMVHYYIATNRVEDIAVMSLYNDKIAFVPEEYYDFYTQKFPDITFHKANVVYCLNYDEAKDKYYCVDQELYSISEDVAQKITYTYLTNNPKSTTVQYVDACFGGEYFLSFRNIDEPINISRRKLTNFTGKIFVIPPDPIREGYTFGGWYKEPECLNKWDFDTDTLPELILDENNNIVFQETALYAKWI